MYGSNFLRMKIITIVTLISIISYVHSETKNDSLPASLGILKTLKEKISDLLDLLSHPGHPPRKNKQKNKDMVDDLVADSIFEDGRSSNNDKLSGSKSVPMTLGSNVNPDGDQQDFCGCATNHKILDETNSRIVGGKEVMPNSLPWQAFVRIKKVG